MAKIKYIIKKETEDINQIPIKKIDEKLLQRFINNNSVKYSSKSISNQIGFISAVLKKYKIGGTIGYWYLEDFKNIGLNADISNTDEDNIRKLYKRLV